MAILRPIARGLRALANRSAADRDVDDEVRQYFDEAAAAYVADGLSPDEARRRARLDLGSMTAVREEVRSSGWEHAAGTVAADARYAARRLRRHPGFTAVCALTLALGTGATAAIFSAVNPILFQPLPYPHAERIVTIWDHASDGSRLEVTFGTYRELLARARSFDAIAVFKPWRPAVVGAGEPERLDGQRVAAGFFRVLGVAPAFGREFDATDDRAGGPRVAILGDGLWRRRFGADPAVVGRDITLDGNRYTVVGVMPRAFENVLSPSAEIWAPLQYDASLPPGGREWGHHLRMAARLGAGVSPERAHQDTEAIGRTPVVFFQRPRWAPLTGGLTVVPLQEDVTRGVKAALVAVLGAAFLVLLIACVNVTNLLLARGAERRAEFAMRAALGAGRARLIRQVLTESVLLAGIGGALGLAVAAAGVRVLLAVSPAGLPRAGAIRVDGGVFLFAVAATTVVGLLVGLVPALHAARGDLRAGLQQSSRTWSGGHHATRRALVIAEVALALVLLAGAGLLLRSLQRLFAVPPGFDAAHVLTLQVQTSGSRFQDAAVIRDVFARSLDAVRRVPGVSAAGFTSQLPLTGDFDLYGVHFADRSHEDPERDGGAFRYAVTPGYFEAIGIPLAGGRLLDARDVTGSPGVVLINESFAKRRFPSTDPIGQRVRVGPNDGPWATVAGVVGNVRQMSLAADVPDAVYLPSSQWPFPDQAMWLVVRAHGDAAALAPAIKEAIWSIDKDQPIVRVATMEARLAASAAERRFTLVLLEAFALVALALAATGIYGVLSGSVTERTREIGVRAALGASRRDILALIVGQGMSLTAAGIAAGLAGALAASGALSALLFGVSRLDPIAYAAGVALLAAVSAAACALPAWRAARLDPAATLRA